MDVNARGAYYCYRFAGEQMVKQGHGGRIVGASSVMGKKGTYTLHRVIYIFANELAVGRDMVATYSASKFAVRGLTQSAGQYGFPYLLYHVAHDVRLRSGRVGEVRNHCQRVCSGAHRYTDEYVFPPSLCR